MREALHAYSLVCLKASLLDLLARLVTGKVEATLARDTAKIIIGFTLVNDAVAIGEDEGFVTLGTGMVRLLVLAS
jgi:hypothetical protein